MGVFVMPLPWLGVVAPGLSNPQIDLVLGVVDCGEVISQRGLNKVPQLSHLLVSQNRVVDRGSVAHVRPCLLALDEVNLFLGQITVEFVDTYRSRK